MKYYYVIIVLFTLVVGCNSTAQKTENSAREEIKQLEDSIAKVSMNLTPGQNIDAAAKEQLVEKLVNYYQSFPKDKFAPEYIDKLHMLYIGDGNYEKAMKYADTLLNNYKEYINRPMILESMANAYDMFVQPRDTSKVRYYNQLLLKENPDLPKDKVEEIQFRLDHLDLTIDQLIDLQIESMMQK